MLNIRILFLTLCFLVISSKGYSRDITLGNFHISLPTDLILNINPTMHISQIAGSRKAIAGLGILLNYNEKLALGAVYRVTLNEIPLPKTTGEDRFQLRELGIHFQYTDRPRELIHFSFPFTLGVESILYSGVMPLRAGDKLNYIFLEPGVSADISIIKYVKFGIGLRYHFVPWVTSYTLQSKDLSNISLVFSAMFGIFNFRSSSTLRF